MSPRVIKIDWLHTVDKGVGVWFLGGIFLEVLAQPCYGGNQTQRLVRLWGLVRRFYADYGVTDRLSRLNQNMIKNHLSSLGAAEARALIPFGVQMADDLCRDVPGQAEIVTLRAAMGHLSECYQMLSKDRRADVEAGALRVQALAFHDLLISLHKANPEKWLLKPKHHLFLELAADRALPSSYWTYREESFGGSLSHMGHTKGGKTSVASMSRGVLQKFCGRERVPRMLLAPAQ